MIGIYVRWREEAYRHRGLSLSLTITDPPWEGQKKRRGDSSICRFPEMKGVSLFPLSFSPAPGEKCGGSAAGIGQSLVRWGGRGRQVRQRGRGEVVQERKQQVVVVVVQKVCTKRGEWGIMSTR